MKDKIKELIKEKKIEFRIKTGLNLNLKMISIVTGLSYESLRNLDFIQVKDETLEKWYNKIKKCDPTILVNKKFLNSNR